MPTPVQNLFNPSVGIQSLMPMPDVEGLPEARDLASGALQQSTLQSLYGTKNAQTTVEAYLCPDVGDGTLVSPEVFGHELETLLEKLRGSDNPKVRAMLEDVIVPLLENGQLLSAYRGLMIGG